MKTSILFTLALLIAGSFYSFCFAQQNDEVLIRNLENEQREAFLKKDTAMLFRLVSPDFVVNAPTNRPTTLAELKQLMRLGYVDLDSFERYIEKITFINNIAVVMGYDVVYPSGKMPDAGKKVKRRYTNIWMKSNSTWQLVARQATIISIN
jgi:hypothetical protein